MSVIKSINDCMDGSKVVKEVQNAAKRTPDKVKIRSTGSSHFVATARAEVGEPAKTMTLHNHKTGKGLAKKWFDWLLAVKIITVLIIIAVVGVVVL